MTSFPPPPNAEGDVMTALGIGWMKVTFTAYRQGRWGGLGGLFLPSLAAMRMSAIVRDKHPWVSKVHVVAVKAQRPLKAGRRLGRREDFPIS